MLAVEIGSGQRLALRDLIFANTDIAPKAAELDHPAFFTVTLNGDSSTVFQDQGVLCPNRTDPRTKRKCEQKKLQPLTHRPKYTTLSSPVVIAKTQHAEVYLQ